MSAASATSNPRPLTPTELPSSGRFGQLATEEQVRTTVAALEQNGIHTILARDRAEAVKAVLDLIPVGSEVFDSASQTLVALGLDKTLADPARFRNIRAEVMRFAQ